MITDDDIEKLKTVFATKDDLVDMERRLETRFATKNQLNDTTEGLIVLINSVRDDLRQEIRSFREEIIQINRGINNMLENHERRITKLEDKSGDYN